MKYQLGAKMISEYVKAFPADQVSSLIQSFISKLCFNAAQV